MPCRAAMSILASISLAGCALSQSTPKVAIDYNRDFAKSRNEMLLLNVLRAAAREPLQFSTMGVVSGSVGNGASIEIPFTNLIGGKDLISPKIGVTDSVNPSITITPLASKDFATGILSPLRTDTLQLFLHNGWDGEFLLPLVVGGVICPDRRLLMNSGEYLAADGSRPSELHLAFKEFFSRFAPTFVVGHRVTRRLTLQNKDVLDALKNGLGANLSISDVGPESGEKSTMVLIDAAKPIVHGDLAEIDRLCRRAGDIAERQGTGRDAKGYRPLIVQFGEFIPGALPIAGPTESEVSDGSPRIVFRSVGSIIQYLGESHRVRYRQGASDRRGLTYWNRDGDDQILFKIDWWLDDRPKLVSTRFHDSTFYLPRLDLRRGEDDDRSLKTLSFLDQLIALQTSESTIRGTQPVLTISQ